MTKTEKTYYAIVALWNLPGWFMHPVYPMFLLSRGLDLFQVSLILAIFQISVFLFEVPTGAIADLYGRKVSFLLSCLVRMFAFTLYSVADGFTACAIAEVIDAVGLTLASGALEAWAVDGIRAEQGSHTTEAVFARAQMILRIVVILGGITCGYLADAYGLALPWLVAASLFGVSFIVGWAFMYRDRPAERRSAGSATSLTAAVAQGMTSVREHDLMRAMCLLTFAMGFAAMPVILLWPPHLESLAGGRGYSLLGWSWAFLNLAAVAGAALVNPLLRWARREQLLFATALWRAVFLFAAALATRFESVLVLLLVYEMALAAREPIMSAWMNEHIESEQRATVLSIGGMSFMLGGSMGLACLGAIARGYGVPLAWIVAACVYALAAPANLSLGRIAARLAQRTERAPLVDACPSVTH